MLTQFSLDNGLQVAAYNMPNIHSISLSLMVKGGASFDKKGKMGTAHLLEHMLLQGSPSFADAQVISEFVESRAGYINAFTYFDTVELVMRLPDRYLEDMLKLATEIFYQPTFPEEALVKERAVMLEEIYANYESTHDRIGRFFLEAKYAVGSLLKNEVVGLPEDVKSLNMQDMKELYEQLVKTENSYLCLVGNFEKADLKKLVEEYFGPVKTSGKFVGELRFSDSDLNEDKFHWRSDADLSSAYVDLSFKAMPKDAPVTDWLAQLAVMNVLANLQRSRLNTSLRFEKGLVYSIAISPIAMPGFGMNNLPFECRPENVKTVLEEIVNELIKIKQNGLTQEEFTYIQNYGIDTLMMQFDSVGAVMDTLKQDLLWEDKIYLPEDTIATIKAASLDDVNAVIKQYWDYKTANLSIQIAGVVTEDEQKYYLELLEKLQNA